MPQEVTIDSDHSDQSPFKKRWQENNGTLLMGFVGLIFLVGSGVLIYQQTRFVPPSFPASEMIPKPGVEPTGLGDGIDPSDVVMLRITGAATDFGSIKLAIYGNEETFNDPDKALATNTLPLSNGEASWFVPVKELPEQIAIAAYHDENLDEKLSLNRFGIPSERYGFSRNARGLVGPPNFKQSVIPRPEGGSTLDIFIR